MYAGKLPMNFAKPSVRSSLTTWARVPFNFWHESFESVKFKRFSKYINKPSLGTQNKLPLVAKMVI